MALRQFKPTTATRRNTELMDYSGLTKKKPHKALLENVKYSAGKNLSLIHISYSLLQVCG